MDRPNAHGTLSFFLLEQPAGFIMKVLAPRHRVIRFGKDLGVIGKILSRGERLETPGERFETTMTVD